MRPQPFSQQLQQSATAPAQPRRVFVTGMGMVNAAGSTVDETWQAIMRGHSYFAPIQQWDLATWPHSLGAEVQDYASLTQMIDRKLLKIIARQDVLGLCAVKQAIEQSGLLTYRDTLPDATLFNDQTGIFVGSPGNKYYQQYDFLPVIAQSGSNMSTFASSAQEMVHPMWLLRILPNNVLAYTGIQYGFKGANHNITNHAIGGIQAVIEAYHAIASGQVERAVVVAYDNGTEPQALFYYQRLGVISDHALRPFDVTHQGTILGEGAAALVLESETSVQQRQGLGLGELIGGKSATEGGGLFTVEAEGDQLAHLIESVLTTNTIAAQDVGLVVLHGNGNVLSDDSEAAAMATVFAHQQPYTTAYKWAMGHTLAASGVVDIILAMCAQQYACAPGVANLSTLASSCVHLNLTAETRAWNHALPYALVLNRGFSNMNAAVVIKKL